MIGIVVISISIICIFIGIFQEYNIYMLGSEQDDESEKSFNILDEILFNSQLRRLLSRDAKDNILNSVNVRFYLALIADRRDITVPNAAPIGSVGVFASNDYNGFPSALEYPTTYNEFFQKYQKIVAGLEKEKPFYEEIIERVRSGALKSDPSGVVNLPVDLQPMGDGEQIHILRSSSTSLIIAFETWKGSSMEGFLYTDSSTERNSIGITNPILVGGIKLAMDKKLDDNWYRITYSFD